MPRETFRGDPYRVLDVSPTSSDAAIKRRWRELAHQHHPDRASADPERTAAATRRMARINAAYELLRDPDRRRRWDAGHGLSEMPRDRAGARGPNGPVGPPPPRPTRPVTARFDTSGAFHLRNATTTSGGSPLRGQPPLRSRVDPGEPEPLRASHPSGPVNRRLSAARRPPPTLAAARATLLEFGKFRGHTLGQVADFEPTYIDWIARTITRDLDLVLRARVIQADLDERGVVRTVRPVTPGFGQPAGSSERSAGGAA